MQADLIAVPNEVVNDISNLEKVQFVMKAGKVYKNQVQ
jgi:imidazolonepropionase-like amidohydrolase